ncbi:pyridoxamine 5'-phosphate oxidase family protein [Elioraea rosea]|uniref:pyridoxamine 5'-phosphate oxidase family protein n=1 Tax=Elioraea rosea TaxID=2492390 RepID=UPI001182FF1D|nr:pyridoxamine 5'-phosphate oxidase family protein [Elioraea rosea]
MTARFGEIAFTDSVRAVQAEMGSAAAYARATRAEAAPDRLGPAEAGFIAERDTMFIASVGESGWPYVQHRGAKPGFIRVLDDRTLGFLDLAGNRQYITVGNLARDGRVSLLLLDFARRRRLKVLGHARTVALVEDPLLAARLALPGWRGRAERAVLVTVEAFDWNCPAHITPRFTVEEVEGATAPLRARLAVLEQALVAAGVPVPDVT